MEPARLDTTALQRATDSLANALAVLDDQRWFHAQAPGIRDTLLAGVVKNFEFVYELSVKTMRRFVQLEADVPDEVAQWGFRDMLRFVADRGLIDDVTTWFDYRSMRNVTAHTYEQDKARLICAGAPNLLRDARLLLQRLERSAS